MLQGLVLGQHVDEPFADLVTMFSKQLPAPLAEAFDYLSDFAFGSESFRHWAPATRPS